MTRKVLHALGILLGGLLLLLLLSTLVVNGIANRKLESELAKIRQKGEPLTLTEAAPPPIPDAENAALVYKRAFDLLPRTRGTGAASDVKQFDPNDVEILTAYLSDRPEKRGAIRPDQVRRVLSGAGSALALARKAAAMPQVRFPVNWEAGAGALFPHYTSLRQIVRLLGAHALLSAREGRPGDAYADLRAMIGVSRHTLSDPVLIGQLTGYATLAITSRTLQGVMETSPPHPAQAQDLARALAEVDVTGRFSQSLVTERAFGIWAFNLAGKDLGQFLRTVGGGPESTSLAAVLLAPGLGWLARPFVKLDEAFYLPFMTDRIERAKKVGGGNGSVTEEDVPFPRYAVVSKIMMPAFVKAANKRDEALARLALCRWGLALAAVRDKTGHYPATLGEVPSSIGGDLPDDPFTGKPLAYRTQGNGYLLYSVGVNGKDDGGESRRDSQNPEASPPSDSGRTDDVAWRFNI